MAKQSSQKKSNLEFIETQDVKSFIQDHGFTKLEIINSPITGKLFMAGRFTPEEGGKSKEFRGAVASKITEQEAANPSFLKDCSISLVKGDDAEESFYLLHTSGDGEDNSIINLLDI